MHFSSRLAGPAVLLLLAGAAACSNPEDDDATTSEAAATEAARMLESVPPTEDADIERITQMIADTVKSETAAQPEGTRVARRDAHAKHHGCVTAKLTVDGAIPEGLSSPVFRPGAEYDAWVRFSNGQGRAQDDHEGDGRGLAIKLVGVPGKKLLEGPDRRAVTHDFLMINHDVFFVRNVADYVAFQETVTSSGSPLRYFFPSINPFGWRVHEANIARQIVGKVLANPLHAEYFSMAPSLFGTKAVKFSARPCQVFPEARKRDLPESPDYLREALRDSLASEAACFGFYVQVQGDPEQMPVEDPTISWSQRRSPFVRIATLSIPKQTFDTPAQHAYCENLSFTPWHAVPEHRPLGGIQRARKVVYETISTLRHDLNGAPKVEPTDLSVPPLP